VIRDNAVVYEITYPYPPERVWRALTDEAELADWLMPSRGFAAVAGRRFVMSCDPFGEIEAEVLEVDPPRRMSLRWRAVFGTTLVTFELVAAAGGTRLTLLHSGWEDGITARDQFDSGWRGKLGLGLAEVLAR
jgi:uncharacterized protein YndB with AHSA1/START domain